jgi:S1-C subfamily serine protease
MHATPPGSRPKTEERIAIAVAQQTGSLKKFVIGLAVVVVAGIGVLVWLNARSSSQSRDAIAKIMQQSDSLRAALAQSLTEAKARTAGFDSVEHVLRQERDRLTRELQAGGNVAHITSQIDALDKRTTQALSLTNRQISDANGKAVLYIVVEDHDRHNFGGTAFCITPGGLLVTNKHVALDSLGRAPNRVGVYFADTDAFLPAHFVSAASDADLAFVQLDRPGPYPTIRGVASDAGLGAGDPIMVIGFPMGTSLAQNGAIKKTTLTAGFVSKLLPTQIQINAFSAQGSSGSPVFDSHGYVIGVLNAGQGGTSSSISFVVPGRMLVAALPPDAKAIVKQ